LKYAWAIDVEAQFQRLCFSNIGSLYFKEDVKVLKNFNRSLFFSENKDAHIAQFSERYRIGPLHRQWWRGERAHLELDRGPCVLLDPLNQFLIVDHVVPGPNATAYFTAAAMTRNEQKVLDRIDLTSNRYRRYPLHDRNLHSKLLAMYLAATSILHIMPSNDSDICAPTLWHQTSA
jgi:hypothetical protein